MHEQRFQLNGSSCWGYKRPEVNLYTLIYLQSNPLIPKVAKIMNFESLCGFNYFVDKEDGFEIFK